MEVLELESSAAKLGLHQTLHAFNVSSNTSIVAVVIAVVVVAVIVAAAVVAVAVVAIVIFDGIARASWLAYHLNAIHLE
eukprot:CAMPEP_0183367466 /NCGR_PEP_ID=MMETSP0164_2-20130417/92583_1 /TAXON_ID=221442 /ORGANISM="Coccolithus pelagicus ssp braarudi, Strain PLY182g" /LENGTH=78 /DNA_ID=CAMNT_0025543403 /DNA_START=314 /DNA_END=550 /DNA_ORIENTATION=-